VSVNIRKYVAECDLYQRNKNENVSTPGLLHLLHIPNKKWEAISMDFIKGLPISDGKDKILVVVDRLTKYAHFIEGKQIQQIKWLKYSVRIFTNYMGSLRLSSTIEMSNLKLIFGENFANRSKPLSI
jgi:hypothetical protein